MNLAKMLFGALFLSSVLSLAADHKPADAKAGGMMKPPTKEERVKMAAAHEKMATCLKSDSSMEDCHKEMVKVCEETHGKGKCPMMMGKGDMGHGTMMHGGPGMMGAGKGMNPEMMKKHEAMMKEQAEKADKEKTEKKEDKK